MAYNAYVLLRRGGYQPVLNYVTFAWDQHTFQSGFYRDTGWSPMQLPLHANETVGAATVLNQSLVVPATGTAAIPDEMADVDPRQMSYTETRLSFYDIDGQIIAQFWFSQFIGWSESPPNTE